MKNRSLATILVVVLALSACAWGPIGAARAQQEEPSPTGTRAVLDSRPGIPSEERTLEVTLIADDDAGTMRVSWEETIWFGSMSRSPAWTTNDIIAGYEVTLTHEGVRYPWPQVVVDPWIDLPLDVLRFEVETTVGIEVTALVGSAPARITAEGSVTFPAWEMPPVDMDPVVTWEASNHTTVVNDGERRAEGLTWWVDGNIGFLEIDGQTRSFAANGGHTAQVTVDTDQFLGEVLDVATEITGIPEHVDYAAGGPVYRDPESGSIFLFYHGEIHPASAVWDFWSFVGLAVSSDEGATFTDLGPIVTPNSPMDADGWSSGLEVGGAPYVIRDGNFYVYFRDVVELPGHLSALNLSVARAPVAEVVAAGLAGDGVAWTKLGDDGWNEPGIAGRPTDLIPDAPHPNWFDVTYLADHDLYVLVASHGSFWKWSVWAATSRDGIHWSEPQVVLDDPEGIESLYVSLSSPDLNSQRVVVGDVIHLYRTRSTVAEGPGHRWDGDVTIERSDLRVTVASPSG